MEIQERARLVDQRRLYVAALYEVALSGNVSEFESLLEKDQLILDRVLVSYSDETPLHIAALRGHLDLTKELLKRCPNLATELDSFRRSPLHLASARGHTDIVHELLQVNSGVCSFGDEDDTTPLHLAAIKGRVEVIRELVRCRPESTRETLGSSGETVLHLCVKHNRLEALKLLMEESVVLNEDEFVNQRDNRGNTILHLAAALKQVKTVEYLVQIEAVKGQANMKNRDGFTALDILEHNPVMDSKSREVRELLIQAAAGSGGEGVNNPIRAVGISDQKQSAALERTIPAAAAAAAHSELKPQTGCCSCKLAKERACGIWDKYFKIDEKWIEVARGNLIMAATLTATVAFQAGLTPPGSVWQSEEDFLKSTSTLHVNFSGYGSGASIMATLAPDGFIAFMTFNTVSFISSVCVILMMMSGFPLNNKFSILLLTLAMCTTFTFMVLTYIESLSLLVPRNETTDALDHVYKNSFATGIALFALVFVIHLTHVCVWTVRKGPQSCLVKPFIRCWRTVADRAVLVLRKPARTDENGPHHHQTA